MTQGSHVVHGMAWHGVVAHLLARLLLEGLAGALALPERRRAVVPSRPTTTTTSALTAASFTTTAPAWVYMRVCVYIG